MATLEDVFEEKERENFYIGVVILSIVVIALVMGAVKVNNELQMTKAYDRQAAALERIADSVEVTVQLKDAKDKVTVMYGKSAVAQVTSKELEPREGSVKNGRVWIEGDYRDCLAPNGRTQVACEDDVLKHPWDPAVRSAR